MSGVAPDTSVVFTCRRCGDCCHGSGGIVLLAADSDRLAAFFGLPLPVFLARFTEFFRGKRGLAGGKDGKCVFSGPEGCSAHPAKPAICRAWPFFRGNLTDAVSFAMAKSACPGIRKGCTFSEFSRIGARYLLAEGLFVPPGDVESPAALMTESMLRQLAGGEADKNRKVLTDQGDKRALVE